MIERGYGTKFLRARYGSLDVGAGSLGRNYSSWWKNICLLGRFGSSLDWFAYYLKRNIGNEDSTRLLVDKWVGVQSLKDLFPRLFYISEQKNQNIDQFGVWVGGSWEWKFKWRRELFEWERILLGS